MQYVAISIHSWSSICDNNININNNKQTNKQNCTKYHVLRIKLNEKEEKIKKRGMSTHSSIEERRVQYGGISIPIRVSKGSH
jgi:23S rRNA maturation mini-RNase III